MKNIIFLIGYMGAGKSSFGKRLAKKIKYGFLDLDQEIEWETKRSISEIFQKEGEAYFRELETEWLKKFEGQNIVLALGGGTPCFNNNMRLLQKMGDTIYLELSPKILRNRLEKSKNTRPLIEPFKHNSEELLAFIEEGLAERLPYYEQSRITIGGSNFSAKKIEELIRQLNLNHE